MRTAKEHGSIKVPLRFGGELVTRQVEIQLVVAKVSPELSRLVGGSDGVLGFLEKMGKEGKVGRFTFGRFSDPKDRSSWNWKARVRGKAVQPNKAHIKRLVRELTPRSHEWIPVGMIHSMVHNLGESLKGKRKAVGLLSKWIAAMHINRSPTPHVVFKPTEQGA